MGLNESYATLQAQILLMDPLPDITKVFPLIIQEEHQCSLSVHGNLFPSLIESALSFREMSYLCPSLTTVLFQ